VSEFCFIPLSPEHTFVVNPVERWWVWMDVVHPQGVRNVPGRNTDVSDAAWLADLGAHGLVTASFVPPPPPGTAGFDPHPPHTGTLTRGTAAGEAARRRRDQTLIGGHRHTGVSGRAMLEALIAGQADPAVIADLAKRTLRRKIPVLTEAFVAILVEDFDRDAADDTTLFAPSSVEFMHNSGYPRPCRDGARIGLFGFQGPIRADSFARS
jgi:hypothetical protein